jgi:stage V sporulation protein AD
LYYKYRGTKEGVGPLKDYFDIILQDDLDGKDSLKKLKVVLCIRL